MFPDESGSRPPNVSSEGRVVVKKKDRRRAQRTLSEKTETNGFQNKVSHFSDVPNTRSRTPCPIFSGTEPKRISKIFRTYIMCPKRVSRSDSSFPHGIRDRNTQLNRKLLICLDANHVSHKTAEIPRSCTKPDAGGNDLPDSAIPVFTGTGLVGDDAGQCDRADPGDDER